MTDPTVRRRPKTDLPCTQQIIESACIKFLDSVLGLQGIRANYGVNIAYEPKEKFRVYTVTVSEKVE